MNPLVDEYSKSEKGTNLAALAEAERKAEDFVDRVYLVTALIMLTEVFLVYGLWLKFIRLSVQSSDSGQKQSSSIL